MKSENMFNLVKKSSLVKIKKAFHAKNRKQKDENGVYLTFYAALRGKLDILNYLLSQKVSLRGSDIEKNTILFYAIKGNNLEIVKIILEQNINVNQLNKFGASAACYLEKDTKKEIIEILIKNGLNINTKYKIYYNNQKKFYTERTILLFALKSQNIKIINLLVEKKVNFSTALITEKNNKKKKMIYYILYYGNLATVKLFLDNDINIKLKKDDINILSELYIRNNKLDLLKLFLYDLKYEIKDLKYGKHQRYNALTYSIKNKAHKITKLLIKYGFDDNLVDDYFYKAICYAVKHNEIKTIELLSNNNVNYVVDPSLTLLEMASENENKKIVKYLLENPKLDFKKEFKSEVILDFGPEISVVYDVKNYLNSLINYNFGITYIRKAIKQGVEVYDVHLLLAIMAHRMDVAILLMKTNKKLDLLKENEINTETILSFMIQRCDIDSILDFLKLAIKENHLLYYIIKFEYEDVFKKLNLLSNNVIPEFNIEEKFIPIIPLVDEDEDDETDIIKNEEEEIPENNFILNFGKRMFQVYFSNKNQDFIITDNNNVRYKKLPKTAKKDDTFKASQSISFFNKYKKYIEIKKNE